MKLYNKIFLICGLAVVLTACYEKPPAPIDDLIKESLGGVPVAADYQYVSDDPVAGGQVSFTFLFWSNENIQTINMYESLDNGTTLNLIQTNTYSESAFSATYASDSIAYTFTIPASLVAGDDLDYVGEVVNENGNTDSRQIDFDVN